MMIVRPIISLIVASFALAGVFGCAQSEQAAAIKRNLSDAEIRVDRFESNGGLYLLRGYVVSATPVGGAEGMAEPGQEISLTPWFPGDRPDPGNPAHSRLLTLTGVPPGSTIRCRIGLDAGGGWRIISVE